MKLIAIIIFLLSAELTFAQTSFDQLLDKAHGFNFNTNQFDSALYYYRQVSRIFPDRKSSYISYRIAESYLSLRDTGNAEKYFLNCLSFDKRLDSMSFVHQQSALSLSKIYFDRKDYRSALTCLEYSKTKYRPLKMMCEGLHGGYEASLDFAYMKSLCYYGLHKKDSAVAALAPLIFRPRWDVYLDSLEFELMTRFFVNTVFEVYGVTEARLKLQNALSRIIYKPVYHIEKTEHSIWLSLDCSITFAKTKINLEYGGGYGVTKKGEIPEFLSKQNLLKEFTDSPAYRYIMGDEECSHTFVYKSNLQKIRLKNRQHVKDIRTGVVQ
jgi:tetratricopeptide (TPR) repeat protein